MSMQNVHVNGEIRKIYHYSLVKKSVLSGVFFDFTICISLFIHLKTGEQLTLCQSYQYQ